MAGTIKLDHKIGLRDIRALEPNTEIFDGGPGAVPAFSARRRTGKTVSYSVFCRPDGGKLQRVTIGRHGSWTPNSARGKARETLTEAAKGLDPRAEKRARRKDVTMTELCDRYLAEADAGRILGRKGTPKKASTLAIDRGRIAVHIKRLIGKRTVASIDRNDVTALMHDIAEGKSAKAPVRTKPRGVSNPTGGRTAATRVVGLLGGIFACAIEWGLRKDNPAHGVRKFPDGKRHRRISDEEYAALGGGLRKAEAKRVWPSAIGCVRFLALTGWRTGEAVGLRRQDVDQARRTATLGDTKTGRSVRPLARAACDVIHEMPLLGGAVFPSSRGDGAAGIDFKAAWRRISKLSGLPGDVTPHVLRHSFASLAADLGFSEPTIAALVGHSGRSVTSRYTHAADAVLLAAADTVANETLLRMGETKPVATIVAIHR